MDDQAIKDEIIEAEGVIRGLAQHMQDAVTMTKAAETAKRNFAEATTVLLGASANFQYLSKSAEEAFNRVEISSREASEHSKVTLSAAIEDMRKGAEELLAACTSVSSAATEAATAVNNAVARTMDRVEAATRELNQRTETSLSAAVEGVNEGAKALSGARDMLCSAAQDATKSAESAAMTMQKQISTLDDLGSGLSTQITSIPTRVALLLAKDIRDVRTVAENSLSQIGNTRSALQSGFAGSEEKLQTIRLCLDKLTTALDAMTSSVKGEIENSRIKTEKRISGLESFVRNRLNATDKKLVWILVLQGVTLIAAAAMLTRLLIR